MMASKSYKHIIILSEQKFENGSSKYTLDQYQEALFKRLKQKFESNYSIFLIQSLFDSGLDFQKCWLSLYWLGGAVHKILNEDWLTNQKHRL